MAYKFDETTQKPKKPRKEQTLKYIAEINKVLEGSREPLKIKQIYEILLKRNVLDIDHYKHFRRYLEAGIQDGLIKDLFKIRNNKERKKVQDEFTKEEMIKLFDNIDDPRTTMACLIGWYCALRINEVGSLKWSDFDMENLKITVAHGKGGVDNEPVHFPRELVNIINLWREYCGDAAYFIPNRIGDRDKAEYKSIHRDFRKALATTGLDIKKEVQFSKDGKEKHRSKFVFHTFRRTRLTFLHRYEGWSLRQVQIFARHKRSTTTEDYVNVSRDELRNLMDNQPYRFQRNPHLVTEQETTPQFQLEMLKEINKKQELELTKIKMMKELKELEMNLNQK